ncbi:hypothetical protein GQ464_002495 [Rhodocaloribacter litoris]|uniref:hypothetical protein n=1 Tax=Rhodocaloribacter litoris TaxID=2558931 RepID=UPI00141E087A|nr:hypothetical protein [Rhodocaloribacter litoris]QXD15838.1 hypothetical protein GQ464_002495 [Rhodocaloribacter litoris]
MKDAPVYTHPTFEHFLRFHLDTLDLGREEEATDQVVARLMSHLKKKAFPLGRTTLAKDVHVLQGETGGEKGLKLVCTAGEATEKAFPFLIEKMVNDRRNDRCRHYGPIVIASEGEPREFLRYYDQAVRNVFMVHIARSIFFDPATMKTSWYGQVNSHLHKRYLEEIVNRIMTLEGISLFLTPHLMTPRGRMILTDSTRAASLAITLIQQIHPGASDQLIYTVGLACLVQHFGALFNDDEDYYPGKIYEGINDATVEVLAHLGILEGVQICEPLAELGIDAGELLELVRYRSGPPPGYPNRSNLARIYCIAISNQIVSAYFTEETRVIEDGEARLGHNPSFGSLTRTMERLDQSFGETFFYRFHREKIERFISNADRYYRLHTEDRIRQGQYVSAVEYEALEIRDGKGKTGPETLKQAG